MSWLALWAVSAPIVVQLVIDAVRPHSRFASWSDLSGRDS